MRVQGSWAAIKRAMVLFLATSLVACGGGGGGSGNAAGAGDSTTRFSASIQPASIDIDTIDGQEQTVRYTAQLSFGSSDVDVILVGDADPSIIGTFTGEVSGNTVNGVIAFPASLPAGTYDTEILLHACFDDACTRELSGSPARMPVHYVVKPNISVDPQVTLSRNGADAAPAITLPVTVPAAAGTVSMTLFGQGDAIAATFDGTALIITTTQARAGRYVAQVVLQGSGDVHYSRTVSVDYTVHPPSAGEAPMSATLSNLALFLKQSDPTTVRTITVTPPTWTDSPITARLDDASGMMSLSPGPGRNEYRLSINPANQPISGHEAFIDFMAGPTGETLRLHVHVEIGASFFLENGLGLELNASTRPSDLQVAIPVQTVDGSAAVWSASTSTSWLSVAAPSGPTGSATPLVLRVDPAIASASDFSQFGSYTVATNQPGTTPLTVQASLANRLPWLQRTSAVLTGSSGRLYVDGAIGASRLIESQALHVTGATLVDAAYRTDSRFLGDMTVLAVDVTGATPGTPITISTNTPLFSSQVQVAVQAAARVAPDYLPLALDAYRPAQFAPGQGAFYFSSPGKVLRWTPSGTAVPLVQASIAGVTGLAMRPDEALLHATRGATVLALDPTSLAVLASSPPLYDNASQQPDTPTIFDGSGPSFLPTLAYASDGRALASIKRADAGNASTRSAYWIAAPSSTRALADLAHAPMIGDPGTGFFTSSSNEAGTVLVASPSQHAVASSNPDGVVTIYLSIMARWSAGPRLGAGQAIVAISDDGQTLVSSNGSVYQGGTTFGNLTSLLPQSELAGGYSLTQDGHFALIYSYQIAAAPGPASNARLRVVDLSQARLTLWSPAAVISTIALSAPVGCTGLPLASGESCQHTASITLTPGSGSAFILGPRAVAAVPLPAAVAAQPLDAGKRVRQDAELRRQRQLTPFMRAPRDGAGRTLTAPTP